MSTAAAAASSSSSAPPPAAHSVQTVSEKDITKDEEPIGVGATAIVYRAIFNGATFAFKKFHPNTTSSVRRELAAAVKLAHHPSILTPLFVVVSGSNSNENNSSDIVGVLLELMPNGSVASRLKALAQQQQNPSPSLLLLAVRWALDLATGLEAAHQLGVLHGDIKPDNLLLTATDKLKITDLGSAHVLSTVGATAATGMRGTPLFMAPEHADGEPLTAACDVFSFGMTLWQMLHPAVTHPFGPNVTSIVQITNKIFRGIRPAIDKQLVPPALEQLVVRCWDNEPTIRPTITEAAVELLAIQQSLRSPASTATTTSGDQQQHLQYEVSRPFACLPASFRPSGSLVACLEQLIPLNHHRSNKMKELLHFHKNRSPFLRSQFNVTDDEALALTFYTMDLQSQTPDALSLSPFQILNRALTSRATATELQPLLPWIFHLHSAITTKLPATRCSSVYRGMKGVALSRSANYAQGRHIWWPAFTSTTTQHATMIDFAAKDGTLIVIEDAVGVDISDFSLYPESEVLLPPNSHFVVQIAVPASAAGTVLSGILGPQTATMAMRTAPRVVNADLIVLKQQARTARDSIVVVNESVVAAACAEPAKNGVNDGDASGQAKTFPASTAEQPTAKVASWFARAAALVTNVVSAVAASAVASSSSPAANLCTGCQQPRNVEHVLDTHNRTVIEMAVCSTCQSLWPTALEIRKKSGGATMPSIPPTATCVVVTELNSKAAAWIASSGNIRTVCIFNSAKVDLHEMTPLPHVQRLLFWNKHDIKFHLQLGDADRFAAMFPNLVELSACRAATDATVRSLSRCTSLQWLTLAYCSNVTDAGLQHLSGMSSLESLDLTSSGERKITGAALQALKASIPNLIIIGVSVAAPPATAAAAAVTSNNNSAPAQSISAAAAASAATSSASKSLAAQTVHLWRWPHSKCSVCKQPRIVERVLDIPRSKISEMALCVECVKAWPSPIDVSNDYTTALPLIPQATTCVAVTELNNKAAAWIATSSNIRTVCITNCGTINSLLHPLPQVQRLLFLQRTDPGFKLQLGDADRFAATFPNLIDFGIWHVASSHTLCALRKCSRLQSLSLYSCVGIRDADLQELSGLTALHSLALCNGLHSPVTFFHLGGMSGLRALDFSRCNMSMKRCSLLRNLPAVTDLRLTGCSLTDSDLSVICGRPALRQLDIGECEVTDVGLQHLGGLAALEQLNLGGCTNFTDAGLLNLRSLPALQSLSLDGCQQITDSGLEHLSGLTSLRWLDLGSCVHVTDAGLQHLRGLKALESLQLDGCDKITDAGLQHLSGLTALRSLYLGAPNRISAAATNALKTALPKLEIILSPSIAPPAATSSAPAVTHAAAASTVTSKNNSAPAQSSNSAATASSSPAAAAAVAASKSPAVSTVNLVSLPRKDCSGCRRSRPLEQVFDTVAGKMIELPLCSTCQKLWPAPLDVSNNTATLPPIPPAATSVVVSDLNQKAAAWIVTSSNLRTVCIVNSAKVDYHEMTSLPQMQRLLFWNKHDCKFNLQFGDADRFAATFPNLVELSAHVVAVDTTIQSLIKCVKLHTLDLASSKITDAGLQHLRGLTALRSLSLRGCKQITDAGLQHLRGLTTLISLDMTWCNQITDAGLQHLRGLITLQLLDVSLCRKISALQYLSSLTALQSLNLMGCEQISDVELQHLSGLTALRSLNLGTCKHITDAGLQHLRGLTVLQSLNLHGCTLITGLQHLGGLTALENLNLWMCEAISDAGLQNLRFMTSLQVLILNGCTEITDVGLQHLRGLSVLKSLDISHFYKITDAGLQHLSGLMALESLDLSSSIQITDAGLHHLGSLTALQDLRLDDLHKITDAGLQYLSGLPALEKLELSRCNGITDTGLQLLSGLKSLQSLSLCRCDKITVAGLRAVRALHPALNIWR